MKVLVLRAAIVAVVLALGVAIGAGPLQEDHDRRARALAAQEQELAARDQEIAGLTRAARFHDAYAAATASRVLRGVLTGRTVALVQLPGADPATVADFRALIDAAGGEVTADVLLSAPVADPGQRPLIGALTSQLATQEDLVMPAGGGGYERFGALLARAVAIPSTSPLRGAPYDATALGIVSGFQQAELVGSEAVVSSRAALTLVVAGAVSADASGTTDLLASVVRAYAARSRVVVAGPTGSSVADGVLALLRGPKTPVGLLSTVDSAELAGARVSAILALAVHPRGTVGSYGGQGAPGGAVPAP